MRLISGIWNDRLSGAFVSVVISISQAIVLENELSRSVLGGAYGRGEDAFHVVWAEELSLT
jgi:hypothetical protein